MSSFYKFIVSMRGQLNHQTLKESLYKTKKQTKNKTKKPSSKKNKTQKKCLQEKKSSKIIINTFKDTMEEIVYMT